MVALSLTSVDLDRPGVAVLRGVDWSVGTGDRWVVIGPNGSGKTTLFELASGYLHPTRGTVEILGCRLGRVDVRRLRSRIGLVSSAVGKKVYPGLTAMDVVVSGSTGALEPWWRQYTDEERCRAAALLGVGGVGHLAGREFGHLSDGERQRVLLARALMCSPGLLLLDEPAAGLDIAGRERLISDLARIPDPPPTVLITHHVEEIPPGYTHALLLREGRIVSSGPLSTALTSDSLSDAFGLELVVEQVDERWTCRAALSGGRRHVLP